MFAVGLAIYAGLGVALADASGRVSDSSLTVLNLVGNEALFVFVVTVGASAFLLGAAAAILSSQGLPR